MTAFAEPLLFAATYVAGCLTGHRVVSAVKAFAVAEAAKLHAKLDALIAKTVNTLHPISKGK